LFAYKIWTFKKGICKVLKAAENKFVRPQKKGRFLLELNMCVLYTLLRSYQRIGPGPRHFETFLNNEKCLR